MQTLLLYLAPLPPSCTLSFFTFHNAKLSLSHRIYNLGLGIMPVKASACPVRDTFLCSVIMFGDFSLPPNFKQRLYFSIYPVVPNFQSPAVVQLFALGFLAKPSDRYLTTAARRDVECQL